MARFGLIGPSYQSQSPVADCERTVNWYTEQIESPSGKAGFALYPFGGTKVFATLPEGPVRAELTIKGRTFAIGGTKFCEVKSDGTVSTIGTVVTDDKRAQMVANQTQILICSASLLYVYNFSTGVFTSVASPTGISQIEFLDGLFVALAGNSQQFQISAPLNGTSWSNQDINSGTSEMAGNIVSMIADHRQLILLGEHRSIPYQNDGNALFPINPVPGYFIEKGCGAALATVRLDNSVFFIDQDERGGRMAWRLQGISPVRVSNHAVEYQWSKYATVSDAVAYPFQDQGHSFWQIYFPTANKTWVYDAATGLWHERSYLDPIVGPMAHRSWCHTYNFGKHLVGDWSSAHIYDMSITYQDDAGTPIERERVSPPVAIEGQTVFHRAMQIDVETGVGPTPPLSGPIQAVTVVLADPSGSLWTVGVDDTALLTATLLASGLSGQSTQLYLNDAGETTTWGIGVARDNQGFPFLTATAATFDSSNDTAFVLVSSGGHRVEVSVTSGGVVETTDQGVISGTRPPQLMTAYSDDGGKTWKNETMHSVGMAGEYKTRVIRRRLGATRYGRVYRIRASDPVPWRIIEGYLDADPGYGVTERISAAMRKGA